MNHTPQNPFEAMFRQTQEMAEGWVKAVNPAMAQFNMASMDKLWPTVPAEMLEAFWGKQFNPEGLDAKTPASADASGPHDPGRGWPRRRSA